MVCGLATIRDNGLVEDAIWYTSPVERWRGERQLKIWDVEVWFIEVSCLRSDLIGGGRKLELVEPNV